MEKRGQVAFEYLVIMGFVTFVIVGILGVAFIYGNTIRDSIKVNQIENCANKLISTSESVFYAGYPSKTVTSCYLPDNIISVEILSEEIIFNYQTSTGITKRSFESNVQLSGTLSLNSGINKILIHAEELNAVLSRV